MVVNNTKKVAMSGEKKLVKLAINSLLPINQLRKSTQQDLRSYRKWKTHCGDDFDVLKSALQKYIRRGMWKNKAEWVVREIHLLTVLEENQQHAKACLTNILNRILVTTVEDVSPREFGVAHRVFYLIDCYRNRDKNLAYIAEAVFILCEAKKSRLCSYLRLGLEQCDYSKSDEQVQVHMDKVIGLLKEKRQLMNEHRLLLAKHVYVIYVKLCGQKKFKKNNNNGMDMKTKRKFADWINNILKPHASKHLMLSIMYKLNFFIGRQYFREELLVLLSIFDSYMASMYSFMPESFNTKIINDGGSFDWVKDHKPIIHPPFVYDRHTKQSVNKSMEFFIREGAKIENEDKEWQLPETFKTLYERIRIGKTVSHKSNSAIMINGNCSIKRKNDRQTIPPKRVKMEKVFESKLLFNNTKLLNLKDVEASVKPVIFNAKSLKTPVFSCKLKQGRSIIVKRMNKKFNYGGDALLCHHVKSILGLNTTGNADIFKINFMIDKSTGKLIKTDDYHPAFVTDDISGGEDLRLTHCPNRRKAVFKSHQGAKAICEIIIFRALMGVNDTNMSNILVNEKHELFSVDENFVGHFDAGSVLKSRWVTKIMEWLGKQSFEWPDWIKDRSNYDKLVKLNLELFGNVIIREDNWKYLNECSLVTV